MGNRDQNPTPNRPYRERVVPFAAGDGMALNLINVRADNSRDDPPPRGPVLLVHGAGVRANLFRAPVQTNLVDALVDAGYDVWLENWRASIDLPPNRWTLDQATLYDHPAAVKKIVEQTGHDTIKAVVHCQGSTSFTMSAVAGLVPQVKTVVSNAVSLHPVVPRWSALKLRYAVPLVKRVTPYLSPRWGIDPPHLRARLIAAAVMLTHHECDNPVCKMVSFTYGAGFPALWRHENLNGPTHEWLKGEFAEVPLRFFEQMARCVRRGRMVRFEELAALPEDYAAGGPQTDARFAFFAGEKSGCFLPQSQVRSHEYFSRFREGYHRLHVVPGYSHLDVLIGKDAARDVFPQILEELNNGDGA